MPPLEFSVFIANKRLNISAGLNNKDNLYSESQWGLKQHLTPLTFIVWTKQDNIFPNIFCVQQKEESHTGL